MADECVQLDKKKRMIEALEKSHGIVTRATQIAEVPRSTFYMWLDTDPEFKAAVEAVNESAVDFVESKLFERINGVTITTGNDDEGNPIVYQQPPSDTALIFYLKCKAKKRGYVERQEITGADGGPLEVKQITGITIT